MSEAGMRYLYCFLDSSPGHPEDLAMDYEFKTEPPSNDLIDDIRAGYVLVFDIETKEVIATHGEELIRVPWSKNE